jgi:hypothetical protein
MRVESELRGEKMSVERREYDARQTAWDMGGCNQSRGSLKGLRKCIQGLTTTRANPMQKRVHNTQGKTGSRKESEKERKERKT